MILLNIIHSYSEALVCCYSALSYYVRLCTASLFKWHQLLISHTLSSVSVLLFYLSFPPTYRSSCSFATCNSKHLTELSSLVCTLWLYGCVFVGLIGGPHLNEHASGHCWGCNEPHSCHALSFMTKTHRFPVP